MTTRNFFTDTNIFIEDLHFIADSLKNPENKLFIPDVIISEMNGLKKNPEIGQDARDFSSYLLSLMGETKVGLNLDKSDTENKLNDFSEKYIELINPDTYKGRLFITNNYGDKDTLKFSPNIGENDIKIISAAAAYKKQNPGEDVLLVSADRNVISVAKLNGIPAEYAKKDSTDPEKLSKGYRIITCSKDERNHKKLLEKVLGSSKKPISLNEFDEPWANELIANEYVVFPTTPMLKSIDEAKKYDNERQFKIETKSIKRYDIKNNALVDIDYNNKGIYGIFPRNLEQLLLFDQLLNNDIHVKAVRADAGTGKTFIELAIAMYKIIHKRKEGITDAKIHVIRRAIFAEDYGFLPGDLNEKNKSTYEGVSENYSQIMKIFCESDPNLATVYGQKFFNQLDNETPLVQILPFGTIRGKTIGPNDIVIAEEWQNTELKNSKIMMTRNGDGEVYINGDPYQIDNPYTSPERNGLTNTIRTIEGLSRLARKYPNEGSYVNDASIGATLRLHSNERGIISKWSENLSKKNIGKDLDGIIGTGHRK